MKTLINNYRLSSIFLFLCLTSCEDFLEIETPDHKVISEVVFDSDETALSVMQGIYNQLFLSSFSNGGVDSVTILAGLSGDDLTTIRATNLPLMEFEKHEILPANFRNHNLWSSSYEIIYMANALLEGLAISNNISQEVRKKLEGESRFIRAFTYFYLVNLYGDVPLILTTDYRVNALAGRNEENEVYGQIVNDLEKAVVLLGDDYLHGERTNINRYTAIALLSRVQLYLQNWDIAENLSSQVISQNSLYEMMEDLDQVFLANSREAIWQLSPNGRGNVLTNTNEGAFLIIHPTLSFISNFKLRNNFVTSMDDVDNRLSSWIEFHQGTGSFYPYKYKIMNSTDAIQEYSMVLRLAEQYLIRAEARFMQDNLEGSIADIDKIRSRAGLDLITETYPNIEKEVLFNLIMEERKREFFAEWGHRWLDLKRSGRAGEIMGEGNPQWQDTDVFYPIPESDLMKNPNLIQNNGY